MKKTKKLLALLLSLLMVAGVLPVSFALADTQSIEYGGIVFDKLLPTEATRIEGKGTEYETRYLDLEPGNYYLSADTTLNATIIVCQQDENPVTLNICLNGYMLDMNTYNVICQAKENEETTEYYGNFNVNVFGGNNKTEHKLKINLIEHDFGNDTILSYCSAEKVTSGEDLTVNGGTVINSGGPALCCFGADINVEDVNFVAGIGGEGGCAIFTGKADASVKNCKILHNSIGFGAILSLSGSLTVENCEIADTLCTRNGNTGVFAEWGYRDCDVVVEYSTLVLRGKNNIGVLTGDPYSTVISEMTEGSSVGVDAYFAKYEMSEYPFIKTSDTAQMDYYYCVNCPFNMYIAENPEDDNADYIWLQEADTIITVDNNVTNGKVAADVSGANAGDVVTITATSEDGYEFDGFSAWYYDETEKLVYIEVAEDGTFTVPADVEEITVSAAFKATATPDDASENSDERNLLTVIIAFFMTILSMIVSIFSK